MVAEFVLWVALLAGSADGMGQNSGTTARPAERPAEPLAIRVSPAISLEPSIVEVTVRIPASPDNRVLSVEVDGGDYYRSSTEELDPDGDPLTKVIAYRSVPSGHYTATVKLKNRQGRITTAERDFQVLSRTEGGGGEWVSYAPAPSDAECRLEVTGDVRFGTAVCLCNSSGAPSIAPIGRCQGGV